MTIYAVLLNHPTNPMLDIELEREAEQPFDAINKVRSDEAYSEMRTWRATACAAESQGTGACQL